MQEALTDTEKARLLAELGMTDHAEAFATPAPIVEAVAMTVSSIEREAVTVPVTETVTDGDHDKIAKELLAKARGNLDTAKQLAINWAQAEFDKVKLSKVQAAALGVDKTAHNKAEYARIQREREKVNSAMRKQARGHVATKIALKKGKPEQINGAAMEAFLLAHKGNPLIEQMVNLMTGGE
jgi:hypothetical protein